MGQRDDVYGNIGRETFEAICQYEKEQVEFGIELIEIIKKAYIDPNPPLGDPDQLIGFYYENGKICMCEDQQLEDEIETSQTKEKALDDFIEETQRLKI